VTEWTKPQMYLSESGLILNIPMGEAKTSHLHKVLGLYPASLTLTTVTVPKGVNSIKALKALAL